MAAKKDPYAARLGQRIRVLRDQADLTIRELAAKASVNASYIAGVESGKHNPTVGLVAKLAKGLELEPGLVFEVLGNEDARQLRARIDRVLAQLDLEELRLIAQVAEAIARKSHSERR